MFGKKLIKKAFILAVLFALLTGLAGCSGKETVVLETEDLVRKEGQTEAADWQEAPKQVEESTLFVHICGEIKNPGVYELPTGSRIYDAVEEAGGFTEEAAADYVNLAYVLEDGWRIEIPAIDCPASDEERAGKEASGQEEAGAGGLSGKKSGGTAGISAGITEGAVSGAGTAAVGLPKEADAGLVDLNTATKEELMTLPGVGESRAKSIIAYREKSGGFSKIEDIMQIEGIKEGMFSKMKDRICVTHKVSGL